MHRVDNGFILQFGLMVAIWHANYCVVVLKHVTGQCCHLLVYMSYYISGCKNSFSFSSNVTTTSEGLS